MNGLMHLTIRNHKLFLRNRMALFLSLIAAFVVILLNGVFLKQSQLNTIEQMVGINATLESMVNQWMVAGLISITAVTTTLSTFGIMIQDKESKKTNDFLTAPLSRATIQLSYVLNAFIIGFMISLVIFAVCEIFLVATGSNVLSTLKILQVIGIIILSVTLSSALNLFLVLLINTQNAFSTLSTIVGTAIGFLCAVYIPFGVLPTYVQQIIIFFPVSHTTVLLRQVFMEDSIATVFNGAPSEVLLNYQKDFGLLYELNGHVFSNGLSFGFIIISTIVLTIVSIMIYKKKHR